MLRLFIGILICPAFSAEEGIPLETFNGQSGVFDFDEELPPHEKIEPLQQETFSSLTVLRGQLSRSEEPPQAPQAYLHRARTSSANIPVGRARVTVRDNVRYESLHENEPLAHKNILSEVADLPQGKCDLRNIISLSQLGAAGGVLIQNPAMHSILGPKPAASEVPQGQGDVLDDTSEEIFQFSPPDPSLLQVGNPNSLKKDQPRSSTVGMSSKSFQSFKVDSVLASSMERLGTGQPKPIGVPPFKSSPNKVKNGKRDPEYHPDKLHPWGGCSI